MEHNVPDYRHQSSSAGQDTNRQAHRPRSIRPYGRLRPRHTFRERKKSSRHRPLGSRSYWNSPPNSPHLHRKSGSTHHQGTTHQPDTERRHMRLPLRPHSARHNIARRLRSRCRWCTRQSIRPDSMVGRRIVRSRRDLRLGQRRILRRNRRFLANNP